MDKPRKAKGYGAAVGVACCKIGWNDLDNSGLVRNLLPEERLIPDDMVSNVTFRLTAIAFGLMAQTALAQGSTQATGASQPRNYVEPQFRMGLHLLPSVGWMDVRDGNSLAVGSVMRFGFGFTADVMFADNYAFGTGINVFRNGGRYSYFDRVKGDPVDLANDSTQFLVRRDRVLTQHWVELPLSFKFRTREIGYITYWGQFGLGLGLNLRSTADDAVDYLYREIDAASGQWTEASDLGVFPDEDVPVEDEAALLRAAMIVGLGIEYNLSGKTALLLGATFNNGLFNVISNRNFGENLPEEHILPAPDGSLDPALIEGYDVKMVDNAILFSCGLLF